MKTRLTILCENSVGIPFGGIGEHGFACHIETDHGTYLFDTGQGLGIIQNATVLQKNLQTIDSIMISHGHYDHTGGLPAVLQRRGPVDVYGHPEMFLERFWGAEGEHQRFIGIPYQRSYLESLGAHFVLNREMVEVGPSIYLTGEIPRQTAFETGDDNMTAFTSTGEKLHPDPLRDDLSLVIDSDKGLILVLGCAHAGMVNIINHVLQQLGRERIYAVLGGTHLGFSSTDQFEATIKVLEHYQIERLGVSHCTGLEKAAQIYSRLPERFFFACVGASLEG
ncbi:MAG: MBL fold metallo-hydrolase [Deltaproteobacteria bacterium]|nr:MBL fold metallo-hydrolase [Candidatus Anaeroferrophillus wilburensis]MBN2888693.1 MBL fold metallo-hydrolase [Deltaproteobacteria bacterium]